MCVRETETEKRVCGEWGSEELAGFSLTHAFALALALARAFALSLSRALFLSFSLFLPLFLSLVLAAKCWAASAQRRCYPQALC